MAIKTIYRVLAIILCALLILPSIALGQKQQSISNLDKIYSIVRVTIEKMNKDGVTAKNAPLRNVRQKYGNMQTQFDSHGRIGLLLDLTTVTPNLSGRLEALGGAIDLSLPYAKLISVYMPIDKIEEIAQWSEIRTIRPMTGGVTNTGSATTEGDSIHHAINVRTDLNVLGDSINVGVISDGCVNWLASQASGDLPAGFGPSNYTFGGINRRGWGDEGTAMMEIIHDLAPNATLFFYGALYDTFGNSRNSAAMIEGIHLLVTEKKCKIIVDDLTWFDQPMFEDRDAATAQFVAAASQWAIDTGVVYISSAGNFGGSGTYGHYHYQHPYTDINGASNTGIKPLPGPPPNIPPPGSPVYPIPYDNLHNFSETGGNDPGLQVIIAPMGYLNVILEWNDAWAGSANDYDLYLYNSAFSVKLASSINVQAGAQDPYERITYHSYEATPETVNVVINYVGTVGFPKLLGMYIFGCLAGEYPHPENSIWGQPGVPDVIAVGAVPATNINSIEGFSSHGNYDVYFPAYNSRPKPDVVAVDEVRITGAGGFGYVDGQGNSRFRGTSAAAPHIAGLAALQLSKCPFMTPAQIHKKFERTAFPIVGGSTIYGYGRADIERAMLEVDTTVGSSGPYTMSNTVNVPMFFANDSGYAISNVKVTGGASQPSQVHSAVSVTAGSPYTDAGVVHLGCPSVNRWYQLTKTGGTNGQFNAVVTAYIDESERAATGVGVDSLRMLHWNGSYFDTLPQFAAPVQVANTWKIQATFNNASFSPFFVGYLTRGIDVSTVSSLNGRNDTTVSIVFSIKNTGNGWDTISFRTRDKLGWTIAPVDSALSLLADSQKNVSIRVTIPASDTVGTIDTVWLTARSLSDTTYIDSSYATVKIISTTRRGIDVSTVSSHDGRCDTTVTVVFSIGNTGNAWDTVSFHVYDKRGWTVAPVDSALSLLADSQTNVSIRVIIPASDTIAIIDTVWLAAQSVSDSTYKDSSYATVRIIPQTIILQMLNGWNMVSVPVTVDNYYKDSVFRTASSNVFTYRAGYIAKDTVKNGVGYWIKVDSAHNYSYSGYPRKTDTITVENKWNMVGSISFPVAVSDIVTLTAGLVLSPFYAYDAGYASVDSLLPGGGYWVKTNKAGQFILAESSTVTSKNRITIQAIDELPPPPPEINRTGHKDRIPKKFNLGQNYPNPFNPVTRLTIELPVQSHVRIDVYNVIGQVIATLVEGIQEAGYKDVAWNAGNAPSGIYYCRFEAMSISDPTMTIVKVRKMILIR
jgi:hypothetical protein